MGSSFLYRAARRHWGVLSGIATAFAVLSATSSLVAATDTWVGSVSANWSTGSWLGDSPPKSGDALVFVANLGSFGTTLTDNLLTLSSSVAGTITFRSGAPPYTINPATVGVNGFSAGGSINNQSTSLQTINDAIAVNVATETVTPATGGGNISLGGVISGTGAITTSGAGTLFLTGTNSSYTGNTIFNAAVVNVASLANEGVNSSLGAILAASDTASLQFTGGTLQYTGSTPQSTNRNIRMKNADPNAIDASGAAGGTLSFTATSSPELFNGSGTRSLNLTGSSTGNNLMAIAMGDDASSGTNLIKTGAGTWIYSGGVNNTVALPGASAAAGHGTITVSAGLLVMTGMNNGRLAISNSMEAVTSGGSLEGQANAANTINGISYVLSQESTGVAQALVLGNGGSLLLRSDSSVTFAGGNSFGGLSNATVDIDVNQLTAGTAGGTNQTLSLAPAGFNTANTTINVTGGNGYTLSLGPVNTANSEALTLNASGAGLTIGSISSVGTLTVGGASNTTVSGVINSGTLLENGTGALFLAAPNTYSGPTIVNGGLLAAGGTNTFSPNSAVSVSGGTLDATAGVQLIGALTMGPMGTLNVSVGNLLTSTGSAGLAGSLNVLNFSGGSAELMAYSSETGMFGTVAGIPNGYQLAYNSTQLDVEAVPNWIQGSGNWSAGTNWSGGSSPNAPGAGAVLNQSNSGAVAINLDVPVTIGSLQFATSTTSYSLSGNTLTFNNFGGTLQVTVLGGTHSINSAVYLQGGSLDVSAFNNSILSMGGNISDGGNGESLILGGDGSGKLVLTGTNLYTGSTIVSGGTLQLGTGASGHDGSIVNTSGVTNNSALVYNLYGAQTAAYAFSGSGSLTVSSGTLVMAANGSGYSGPTIVVGGMLSAGHAYTFSPNSAVSVSGGTLDATTGQQTIGPLTMGPLGTLNLSVGNLLTSTGSASLGGSLNVLNFSGGSAELMAYSSETGVFGTVSGIPNGYQLAYNSTQLDILSGPPSWVQGNGNWSAGTNWSSGSQPNGVGAGAVLNQSNSGAVAINLDVPVTLGSLQFATSTTSYSLSGPGASGLTFNNFGGTSQVTVTSGTHSIGSLVYITSGNLDISASNSGVLLISGNIADDGLGRSLILDGDGTGKLVLSGTNNYSGSTVVNAGTLIVNNPDALPAGSSLFVGHGASSAFAFAPVVAVPPTVPAGVVAVPEPGTIMLLLAAIWCAVVYYYYRFSLRRKAFTVPFSVPAVHSGRDPARHELQGAAHRGGAGDGASAQA